MNRPRSAALGVTATLLLLYATAVSPRVAAASADALADSILAAAGGTGGWERARFFAFDFVLRRDTTTIRRTTHHWDRYSGEHRVLARTREGRPVDVHLDLDTRQGEVRMEGAAADDTTRAQWLERAYRLFVNDTYWLLMPFKLRDPGVRREDAGVRTDSTGKEWRVLALSFDDGIGLTSKDHYWVYMDPRTGLVGRWDYHLQGDAAGAPPQAAAWEAWRPMGPIQLSTLKRVQGRGVTIGYENLVVRESVPPGIFERKAGQTR